MVAGGMEATFRPELHVRARAVRPASCWAKASGRCWRWRRGCASDQPLGGIAGTAERAPTAACSACRNPRSIANELRDAIFATPYENMPYEAYWERLEAAYRVGALPTKAAREARLAEIRSVRLITLNYCPMGCTFCSSTNFLHEAQGGVAADRAAGRRRMHRR